MAAAPRADVAVHAIWFPMVRTDARDRWPDDELVDGRVRHWWDDAKVVGRAIGREPAFRAWGPVAWDAWLLYPADARWTDAVPTPVSSGRTIVKTRDRLQRALRQLPVVAVAHDTPALLPLALAGR